MVKSGQMHDRHYYAGYGNRTKLRLFRKDESSGLRGLWGAPPRQWLIGKQNKGEGGLFLECRNEQILCITIFQTFPKHLRGAYD